MTNKRNVIAELGWNFMGDMDLAKAMITSAKSAGANIVKFQYWNPDKLNQEHGIMTADEKFRKQLS